MILARQVKIFVVNALHQLYGQRFNEADLTVNVTKPEFDGDYTLVMFGFIKQIKKSPEAAGKEIGDFLLNNHPDFFSSFNVIKGFLNLTIADFFFIQFLQENYNNIRFGRTDASDKKNR